MKNASEKPKSVPPPAVVIVVYAEGPRKEPLAVFSTEKAAREHYPSSFRFEKYRHLGTP